MKSRGKDREGKLALHFGSKSHAAALERYLNYKVKENHVDLMLDSHRQQAEQQREAVFKHNCTVISILIDISRFLVRQSLAFRGRSGYEEGIPGKKNYMWLLLNVLLFFREFQSISLFNEKTQF